MTTLAQPPFTAQGVALDMSPEAFGELRRSEEFLSEPEELRTRLAEDGYLFLPGALDRDEVLRVRRELVGRLAEGCLDPGFPAMEAVARPGVDLYFRESLADNNPPLDALLYGDRMMAIFQDVLGGPIRHFDFTWMRAVSPNNGTAPHCDIVYMGRGTTRLLTAWTPLGDIPYEMGGLMVLENSHKNERLRETYGRKDADTFCTNRPDDPRPGASQSLGSAGALTFNPAQLRRRLGGRWLTAEFRAGDLLIFGMYTVHASLDNHTDRIRLSSDSRYQLASEPADERWVGEHPLGHSLAAKRGRIC